MDNKDVLKTSGVVVGGLTAFMAVSAVGWEFRSEYEVNTLKDAEVLKNVPAKVISLEQDSWGKQSTLQFTNIKGEDGKDSIANLCLKGETPRFFHAGADVSVTGYVKDKTLYITEILPSRETELPASNTEISSAQQVSDTTKKR